MLTVNFSEDIGNTPCIVIKELSLSNINIYAKLEGCNKTGSVKDRAAVYILNKLLSLKEVGPDTLIIESSSGNFGVALASYCKELGLKFCCVIDKNITPSNEKLIRDLSYEVHKITEVDENGSYLLNRIRKIKELQLQNPNSYWINQYANPYNAEAYYETLGKEICTDVKNIDYIFIGVSSGGTIAGISKRIKEYSPHTKVIAVDIEGSVIFGGKPKKRFIPGIGSSLVPAILQYAKIDEVVYVSEESTLRMCQEFYNKHQKPLGGSSGSVLVAIKQYFESKKFDTEVNVVTIFPDNGERYFDTIYNTSWCAERFKTT